MTPVSTNHVKIRASSSNQLAMPRMIKFLLFSCLYQISIENSIFDLVLDDAIPNYRTKRQSRNGQGVSNHEQFNECGHFTRKNYPVSKQAHFLDFLWKGFSTTKHGLATFNYDKSTFFIV
uniref:Uncharacterized protein n=1 Tax=Romanomermis culicivorax TaxID=13658 RepID=A0A915L3V8_ROMCU